MDYCLCLASDFSFYLLAPSSLSWDNMTCLGQFFSFSVKQRNNYNYEKYITKSIIMDVIRDTISIITLN